MKDIRFFALVDFDIRIEDQAYEEFAADEERMCEHAMELMKSMLSLWEKEGLINVHCVGTTLKNREGMEKNGR